MTISVNELEQCGVSWSDFCDATGYNEWAIKEGQLDRDEELEITVEQAKRMGLVKGDSL